MRKQIIAHGATLILAPLLGFLLLYLVHLLPTEPMRNHLCDVMDAIDPEYNSEYLLSGFQASLTGSFTDSLMLEHAVYDGGHSVLEQMLMMYRAESYYDETDPSIWHPGDSLMDYLDGKKPAREVEYSRYWHGYLLVLKPLLYLTSINSIKLFNSSLQLLLIGVCIITFTSKGLKKLAGAFLCSIPFLYYISMYASLSQSICLYIILAATLIALFFDPYIARQKYYGVFFLLIGMCTSYFDFLTYPILTLCYPLCVYLDRHSGGVKRDLGKTALFTMEWGIGYGWMWGSKWVLSDILVGAHTIQNAIETVFVRTGADQQGRFIGYIRVLMLNLDPFVNWGYILFDIAIVLVVGVYIIKRRSFLPDHFRDSIVFFCLALYPFVWWFLTENHSEEHWMFTCKIFAISVFAGITGLGKMISGKKRS